MHIPDIINGLFEFFGAVAAYKNVAALRRDKNVAGIYWPNFMFYTLWGVWNIYFYPALGQWFSFVGGLAILSGTASWLGLYWYYRYAQKKQAVFE
jgi:hypothetical protein